MKKKKETGWDVFKNDVKRYGIFVVLGIIACFVACETSSPSTAEKSRPVIGVYAKVQVMTLGQKMVNIEYRTQSKSSTSNNLTTQGIQRFAKCEFKYQGNIYEGETLSLKLDSGVPFFTSNDATPEFLIRPGLSTRQTYTNQTTGEMAIVEIQTVEQIQAPPTSPSMLSRIFG